MSCKFYFNIKGLSTNQGEISIEGADSSILSNPDFSTVTQLYNYIAEQLVNSDNFESFKDLFIQSIEDHNNNYKINIPKIQTKTKDNKNIVYTIIPNTNVSDLIASNPNITFPNIKSDELKNANVLIGDIQIGGYKQYGIYKSNDGTITYVIKNNRKALQDFAAYLKVLQEYEQEIKSLKKEDKEIRTKLGGPQKTAELFRKYIQGDDFKDQMVGDIALSTFFNTIYKRITLKPQSTTYDTEVVNNIEASIEYMYIKDKYKGVLDKQTLLLYAREFIKQGKQISDDEVDKVLLKTIQELNPDNKATRVTSKEALIDIFRLLYSTEPQLEYDIEVSGDKLILDRKFKSVFEYDKIGFEQIKQMSITEYKGYLIYEHKEGNNSVYYVSRNYLNPTMYANRFTNIETAKQYVDRKLDTTSLFENSNIEALLARYIDSGLSTEQNYARGQIIPMAKVSISKEAFSRGQEIKEFLKSYTMTTFQAAVQSGKFSEDYKKFIKQKIQSIDDVVKLLVEHPEVIDAIRGEGETLTKDWKWSETQLSHLYVRSRYQGKYVFESVVPNQAILKEFQYTANKELLFSILQGQFRSRGINIKILDGNKYKRKIGEGSKAAILDGTIYLNKDLAELSDAFHEYSHIMLGVLKASNFKHYQELLQTIIEKDEAAFNNFVEESRKSGKYKNRSYTDLQEEFFCIEFGQYFENVLGFDVSQILSRDSQFTKNSAKLIFNLSADDDLKTIFSQYSLGDIFMSFNNEIKQLMASDYNRVLNSETEKTASNYRKASNFIEEQLENKVLKETCK